MSVAPVDVCGSIELMSKSLTQPVKPMVSAAAAIVFNNVLFIVMLFKFYGM